MLIFDRCIARKAFATLCTAFLAITSTLAAPNEADSFDEADRLIGWSAQNTDGQELGKVHDFVLDMRSGRVQYVILRSGGFLGIKTRMRAVPAELVLAATSKKNTVAVAVPK